MKSKYLVSMEFRYSDIFDDEPSYKSKILTIGIYDYFNDACLNGNTVLEFMESKFDLHQFPDGSKANKERFDNRNKLISNLAYLKTPFTFFFSITELKYDKIVNVIDEVLKGVQRYKNWKNANND